MFPSLTYHMNLLIVIVIRMNDKFDTCKSDEEVDENTTTVVCFLENADGSLDQVGLANRWSVPCLYQAYVGGNGISLCTISAPLPSSVPTLLVEFYHP